MPKQKQSVSATAVLDEPRPTYAPAPAEIVSSSVYVSATPLTIDALDGLREQCSNATYSNLDKRNDRWCLMVHGSGQVVREFHSLEQGVEFVRTAKLPKVRCLALPEGVVS